jgi:DNA-binding NtrC family response regulator
MMNMAAILVIDAEQMICDLLQSACSGHGYTVVTATNSRRGLALFQQWRPRVTLLDLRMPEMDGIEILKQIRKIEPKADVIMLAGGGTDALEFQARDLGVTDFFRKGLPLDVLTKTMDRALQRMTKMTVPPPSVTWIGEPTSA